MENPCNCFEQIYLNISTLLQKFSSFLKLTARQSSWGHRNA